MSTVTYNDLFTVVTGMGNKLRDNLWAANKSYKVGDLVIHNNIIYRVSTAYTSGATFSDTNLAPLSVDGGGIQSWTASTAYSVGDLVIYNNAIYQCTTANSDASWTANNWQEIGKDATLKYWASATSYNAGAVVIYSNALYKCTTTHTSGSTFDTSEVANWSRLYPTFVGSSAGSDGVEGIVPKPLAGEQTKFLAGDGIWRSCSGLEDWQANHSYSVGDIFVAENQIWKVVTAFTSGSTFSVTSDIEEYVPKELTSQEIQDLIAGFTPSGSLGSGGVNAIVDTLWTGSTNTLNDVLNLSNPYTNYDFLLLEVGSASVTTSPTQRSIVNIDNLSTRPALATWIPDSGDPFRIRLSFSGSSATVTSIDNVASALSLIKIEGIKFCNPNVYSTTEQRIGTWIDGKPLYQKTYTGTITSSTGTEVLDSNFSIQDYIMIEASGQCGGFIAPVTNNGGYAQIVQAIGNNSLVILFNTSVWPNTGADYYITVRYTKTAD